MFDYSTLLSCRPPREIISEGELIRDLKQLKSILVTPSQAREVDYTRFEHFVWAYHCFYMPTNMTKYSFLMNQISTELREAIKKSVFIDWGCGPGTYSLAYALDGGREVFAIDQSPVMLEQAKRNFKTLFPQLKWSLSEGGDLGLGPRGSKCLCLGHVLEEQGASLVLEWIRQIDPDILIIIEPGTRACFDKVMSLRTSLIEDGFNVQFPCLKNAVCPLQDDWCHQVLRITHDPEIERLGQLAQVDRKIMPFIGHVYARSVPPRAQEQTAQFIRFYRETKFSFEWQMCLIEGEHLESIDFEIMKKSLSKSEIKQLKKASVGGFYSYQIIKELSPSKWRVKLSLK